MLKKLCSLFLVTMLLFTAAAIGESAPGYDIVYSSQNPIPEIAERVRPAVVEITSSVEYWDATTRVSSVEPSVAGSGCYILTDESGIGGYILTNNHIVENCDSFSIKWLSGEEMDVDLIGTDEGTDIAVLKFNDPAPAGVDPIPMGDSDALKIGELAICIGNPGSGNEVLSGTVTAGIISGLNREEINASNFTHSVYTIQVDAAINTGNSGGALLNYKGELVGIPTLKLMYNTNAVYEGLGFCVPINAVRDYIDQIISTGKVIRPRLGITVTNFDGPDEPMKKYPPMGAQVYEIEPNGPCANIGLQVNDIIYEFNGVRIKTYLDLVHEVDKLNEGDSVDMKVYRYYDENGTLTGSYTEHTFTVMLMLIP